MRARRREVADEYGEDGKVAVLTADGEVVVLSELATLAWESLDEEWHSVADLGRELVARFGDPPGGADATEATRSALEILAARGLVELEED